VYIVVCPFVLFLLAIALFVLLQFTDYDYISGVFKLFLFNVCHTLFKDIQQFIRIWKTKISISNDDNLNLKMSKSTSKSFYRVVLMLLFVSLLLATTEINIRRGGIYQIINFNQRLCSGSLKTGSRFTSSSGFFCLFFFVFCYLHVCQSSSCSLLSTTTV
jgi:isoprenylcysteine carboxyl methyltransferase (ICMT) family protein YpbQ